MKKYVLVKFWLILLLISHSALASIDDLDLVVVCNFASGKSYGLNHTLNQDWVNDVKNNRGGNLKPWEQIQWK